MKIKYEDIPDNLKNMYEIVGEVMFIKIIDLYGGQVLYFPLSKSIKRKNRDRDIIKRHNGVNTILLAREYNITPNQIRKIIKRDV